MADRIRAAPAPMTGGLAVTVTACLTRRSGRLHKPGRNRHYADRVRIALLEPARVVALTVVVHFLVMTGRLGAKVRMPQPSSGS